MQRFPILTVRREFFNALLLRFQIRIPACRLFSRGVETGFQWYIDFSRDRSAFLVPHNTWGWTGQDSVRCRKRA